MKTGIGSDTTKSARTLAQQIAKQIAQEPLEILNDVKEQTTGQEVSPPSQNQKVVEEYQSAEVNKNKESNDKMKSQRLMEAFGRELEDIRKRNVFKDLQEKIAQGLEVPLEDYPSLTPEQKDVLKGQMAAVKFQKDQAEYNASQEGPLFGSSKKSRKMGSSQKQEAQKQQTHIEKPTPPSG